MNTNQIINMVMRVIMRRAINFGVNAGINAAAGIGKPKRDQTDDAERLDTRAPSAPMPKNAKADRARMRAMRQASRGLGRGRF